MLDIYSSRRGYDVTKSDTTILDPLPRWLYIGTAGDVSVLLADDTVPVVFKNVANGTVLKIRPKKVLDATGASNILALY